jgi:hypothetical protein
MIGVILLSIFLSSAAEARHGNYSLDYNTAVWGCRHCNQLGLTPRALREGSSRNAFLPLRIYKAPIWPALPAPKLRFLP